MILLPLTRVLLNGHEQRHRDYLAGLTGSSSSDRAATRRQWTRDEVIRDPAFYLFLPALMAQPMLFTGFMFHQVHLVEEKAWSLPAWGGLYVLYALVSTGCKLLAGILVDRYSAVRLVPMVCLPLGLGLLCLATSDSFVIAVLFMCLMGVSIGVYSTLSSPFYAEMYGTLHLGSIKSLTTATMVLATAVTPALMGALIDRDVTMEQMALAGVVYTLTASGLAHFASRLERPSRPTRPGV